MKSLQSFRSQVNARNSGGFSLIELMVALAALSIVAAVAFGAVRKDEFTGTYRHFVQDVTGAMTQARNIAIDEQTQVTLTVFADRVEVVQLDPITRVNVNVLAERIDSMDGGLLSASGVCVYGMTAGAQAPGQAQLVSVPTECLSGSQSLEFQPDGTFNVSGVSALENAGVTLWIADRRTSETKLSMVQMFPGGLIRTFEDVHD